MPDNLEKLANDALSFPVLTKEATFDRSVGQSGMSAAPLSQKVNAALREILGWRPRANDARGFQASLNQAFEITEIEGQTKLTWRQRTFAADADLGAITGAQASIYSRARAALDHSIPVLDGLIPLRADHDLEDIEAAQSMVRSSFTELVYELGLEGGPRLARVDGYFQDLLGTEFTQLPTASVPSPKLLEDPQLVGGQLALLRDEFGLASDQVNTIEEEQNLTNFFILVDSINSLWLTWRTQRNFFSNNQKGKAFLGTQFVRLSRNLAVLVESVEEIYFAMDSVFLGPAERQITKITFNGGEVVFVGESLDWVQRFAAEEGPRLLREAGKDGVLNAFIPTLNRLLHLVSGMLEVSRKNSSNPTAGFHTPRVRRALEELEINLKTTQENAKLITRQPAPEIRLVTMDSTEHNSLMLIINGRNFQDGATVHLGFYQDSDEETNKTLASVNTVVVNSTEIKAFFNWNETIMNKFPKAANNEALNLTVIVINPEPDGQTATEELTFNIPRQSTNRKNH